MCVFFPFVMEARRFLSVVLFLLSCKIFKVKYIFGSVKLVTCGFGPRKIFSLVTYQVAPGNTNVATHLPCGHDPENAMLGAFSGTSMSHR